ALDTKDTKESFLAPPRAGAQIERHSIDQLGAAHAVETAGDVRAPELHEPAARSPAARRSAGESAQRRPRRELKQILQPRARQPGRAAERDRRVDVRRRDDGA